MNFETAAIEMFPELASSDTITRAQAMAVKEQYNMKFPHHVVNPANTVSRGVFKFSLPMSIQSVVVEESDSELNNRIKETYATLDKLVEAIATDNGINSLIVSGAAGLGKSFEVNKVLIRVNAGDYGYVFQRGFLKASHLYRLLWENRLPGQTVVIDDCDAIMSDEVALNILKAALEMKPSRMVSWGSEKIFVDQDGEEIPRMFDYQGNVIFLTNLPFSDMANGNNKNAAHLSALESRSLVLDLKIKTKREVMAKIKMTVADGMLRDKGLYDDEASKIVDFMENNMDKLKDLSLRSAEKLAALYLMDSKDWEMMARTVMFK